MGFYQIRYMGYTVRMMDISKRTKIVCTIGPASHDEAILEKMVHAGMNVCRLNFSHGTHEDHAALIQLIRRVSEKTGEPLAILQDLQGPKIRVGELAPEGIKLEAGQTVIFTTTESPQPPPPPPSQGGEFSKIPVTYEKLHEDMKVGHRILLDDGLISVQVTRIEGRDIVCEVTDGGVLTSHKGMNFPESRLSLSVLTEKDQDDVRFGVEQGVDWIALSFVRSAQDLQELRPLMHGVPISLMAKIEKPEAVEHFDEILEHADGIMVARGDLGIEMPAEKIPIIQKEIVAKCLVAAKPVIVATQMLDSMMREPRATRAEISDIANAVIDHTDATMLSGETATGAYPLEAVQAMAAAIRETEKSVYDDLPVSTGNVANMLAKTGSAKAILVASLSGSAARLVSRFRPELPIFAATPHERVLRQLNLSWGVRPFFVPECATIAELLDQSFKFLRHERVLERGDQVIIIAGEPLGQSGHMNLVEVRTL